MPCSHVLGIALICLGFVVIALLILWIKDRIEDMLDRRRATSPKAVAERRARQVRLLNPDWAFYERHLQRPAPAALRELFADHALITSQNLDWEDDVWLSAFAPLHEQDYRNRWLDLDVVAFATNMYGDPIYLKPGPLEADTVYVTYHDGGDTEVFAESVAAMLEQLRRANPDYKRGLSSA